MSVLDNLIATTPAGPGQRTLLEASLKPRAYLGRVASLPCLVCLHFGVRTNGVHVHHKRAGTGWGRASDYDTMPLCPEHHQGRTGIHGMGTRLFVREYGFSEDDLVAVTQKLVLAQLSPAFEARPEVREPQGDD